MICKSFKFNLLKKNRLKLIVQGATHQADKQKTRHGHHIETDESIYKKYSKYKKYSCSNFKRHAKNFP